MGQAIFKESLLKKRAEILSEGGAKPIQTWMGTDARQGNLADKASGSNEAHIQLKIKQTDAKILYAIEEALWPMTVPLLGRSQCSQMNTSWSSGVGSSGIRRLLGITWLVDRSSSGVEPCRVPQSRRQPY